MSTSVPTTRQKNDCCHLARVKTRRCRNPSKGANLVGNPEVVTLGIHRRSAIPFRRIVVAVDSGATISRAMPLEPVTGSQEILEPALLRKSRPNPETHPAISL